MSRIPILGELKRMIALTRWMRKNRGWTLEEIEDRRYFLKKTAQMAIFAVSATRLLSACATSIPKGSLGEWKNPDDPIVIVGAGIAGLSAAFHLAQNRIRSFEGHDYTDADALRVLAEFDRMVFRTSANRLRRRKWPGGH